MNFEYFSKINDLLKVVENKEKEHILQAVHILTEKICNKHQIFAFGASHAGILTEELFYRAGGLVVINPIFEPSIMLNLRPVTMTSQMERVEGFGTIIAKNTKMKKDDLIIIHSVSGRNPVAIDLAIEAKKIGVTVICITNVSYSMSVNSRHSSNNRLLDVADLVIDNHGDIGDACITIKGMSQKVSPTSTVVGATILNTIVSETTKALSNRGITPPVFFSANLDGGDEHNLKILDEYKSIIHYL